MSVPRSVVRINKKGIKYTSSVDRASYTIVELTRAAMRDVGKYLGRLVNTEAMNLHGGGLKATKRIVRKGATRKTLLQQPTAFLYDIPWAKSGLPHLDIGATHDTWYGVDQELGTSEMPKLGLLRNNAYKNIAKIIEIESQYLSALEDEAKALNMISEEEYVGGGEET